MNIYPKELLFKDRNDIDEFLSEPGLNTKLYDVILTVREPDQLRYTLKVSPLQIMNEAYGQALRVITDKHPEDDYYRNYFLNAKKYFRRSYEAELVFCVVYALLRLSMIDQPNVNRFLHVIERKMADRKSYFPIFQSFVEEVMSNKLYNPEEERFYLHTDNITAEDFRTIRWNLATDEFNKDTISEYLSYAVDVDYQIAMLDSIYADFKACQSCSDASMPDIRQMIEEFKTTCTRDPKESVPLPVIVCETPAGHTDGNSILIEEIGRLKAENEELRQKREMECTEERTVKVKDVFEIARTSSPSVKAEMLNIIRQVIAKDDNNWIECIKAELQRDTGKNLIESKYRITARHNTDIIKIVSAMFDMHLFSTPDGMLASSKQDIMENIGKLFSTDFSKYSASLSAAKQTAGFMDTFNELTAKAKEYYDS